MICIQCLDKEATVGFAHCEKCTPYLTGSVDIDISNLSRGLALNIKKLENKVQDLEDYINKRLKQYDYNDYSEG